MSGSGRLPQARRRATRPGAFRRGSPWNPTSRKRRHRRRRPRPPHPRGPTTGGRRSRTSRCSTCGCAICGITIEASVLAQRIADLHAELEASADRLPSALLAVGRVVHARRRRRHRHPVLSGAPAPREARREPDARSRGRRPRLVHEDPAPRGRTRDRQRVPPAAPAQAAEAVRPVVDAVSGVLHAEAVLQELRPAPRLVVRAEPSRRGLRRDVRGVAEARLALARALSTTGRRSRSSNTWTS